MFVFLITTARGGRLPKLGSNWRTHLQSCPFKCQQSKFHFLRTMAVPLSPVFSGVPGPLGFVRRTVPAAYSGSEPGSLGKAPRLNWLLHEAAVPIGFPVSQEGPHGAWRTDRGTGDDPCAQTLRWTGLCPLIFVCRHLPPNVMVSGHGALGRRLGLDELMMVRP